LKFEVRYPSGAQHEVELEGTVAIVGRDPSCDLVLNDVKCSRRHAVLEAGPQGIAIRDSGSANGVFVNGGKVERASLTDGDIVQLGEVFLKVLAEDVPQTLVMDPEEANEAARNMAEEQPVPPPPAPPPLPEPPPPVLEPPRPKLPQRTRSSPPRPASFPPRPGGAIRPAQGAGQIPRPLTITLLAALWMLSGVVYALGGFALAAFWRHEAGAALPVAGGLLMAVVCAAMGTGIWLRRPWARILQMVFALLGMLSCFFIPVCAAVLVYMLRAEVRLQFQSQGDLRGLSPRDSETVADDSADLAFSGAILGALFLGLLVTLGLAFVASNALGAFSDSGSPETAEVTSQLRSVASAQAAFHSICDAGYADLQGLLEPASAIPSYPSDGPRFLSEELTQQGPASYRFGMKVGEALPAAKGCPARSFRSYEYSAAPRDGQGSYYVVGPDRVIRSAQDRPATLEDPPLE